MALETRCRSCGDCVPADEAVCVWCKEWNLKCGQEDPKGRVKRCQLCQNKAKKILESSGDSNAADIAWSQCEGVAHPNSSCVLWYAVMEAYEEKYIRNRE